MPIAVDQLRQLGLDAGLCAVGVSSAEPFSEVCSTIEQRRAQGLHDRMQFTYRNPARSTDPSRTLPEPRALVVGAYDYQREAPPRPRGEPLGRVAAYSWEDHYQHLRAALEPIAARLRAEGHRAVVLADQNHLVDRAAAHRAGIGWWGKSSNILVPEVGSLVILGSVLTDAPLETPRVPPVADGCQSCTKCLTACPTDAIVAPGVIDARRCLAWLVQAEGMFPIEYREALGDRIYGCDDCQDVCPPNQLRRRRPSSAGAGDAWVSVLDMLAATDESLIQQFGRWYIPRRDPLYLRRNALLVLANTARPDDPRVAAAVQLALAHDAPMIRAHAVWAARRLGLQHLLTPLTHDQASEVQLELGRP